LAAKNAAFLKYKYYYIFQNDKKNVDIYTHEG
jgi:hypothetical protein